MNIKDIENLAKSRDAMREMADTIDLILSMTMAQPDIEKMTLADQMKFVLLAGKLFEGMANIDKYAKEMNP